MPYLDTSNLSNGRYRKKKSTLLTTDEDDNESSSSASTPSISDDITSSATSALIPKRSDIIELEQNTISSAGDQTLNAEADDYTLEFNVSNVNDEDDIYSESLLACDELEPSVAHFPQSIKSKKTNRGTTNRFKIGVAGSDPVYFYDFAPHVFRFLRTKIYGISDRNYLESILPRTVGGDITKVSEEIIANFRYFLCFFLFFFLV